jgi:2-oxoglutarate ferredoxin oxidoreductase subunit alpha
MIGGEAGFGIMTTGLAFAKIAARLGYHTFDYVEYPSLIRGGHNAYEVHVSENELTHLAPTIDVLTCLNKETYEKHKSRLTKDSYVIYDNAEFEFEGDVKKVSVPFKKIMTEFKGQAVMRNTIAMAATLAVIGTPLEVFISIIEEQFTRKGEEVVAFNKQFAKAGYDHVKSNYPESPSWMVKRETVDTKMIMTGNDAFALGAVIADCRFYCAYPMTPSSTVLTTLAAWGGKTGMVVRHAEDEISVVNTAIGASFAGARSSVGTSGGGFALMVESLSFSGVTEIPLVVFLAQRPGPATGMPTWTEQGDLLFAVHSGHGEFPKVVLAPGTVEEMVEMTTHAFNLADIYQMPVIVLSDMYLSEGHKSMSKQFVTDLVSKYKVDRGAFVETLAVDPEAQGKTKSFLRYKVTEDGISPRLVPGVPGYFYQANSYEHLEDGHTTEDAAPRIAQVDKRARKWSTYLARDFRTPKVYGDMDSAETVFVSWGSNKGAILEAQRQLTEQGKKTAFIHFTYMYPLDRQKVTDMFKPSKRYVLVENNSTGQFGKLLLAETAIELKEKILRYDGRPLTAEYIISNLNK